VGSLIQVSVNRGESSSTRGGGSEEGSVTIQGSPPTRLRNEGRVDDQRRSERILPIINEEVSQDGEGGFPFYLILENGNVAKKRDNVPCMLPFMLGEVQRGERKQKRFCGRARLLG